MAKKDKKSAEGDKSPVEESTPKEGKSAGSPWVPVIVMMVALPIISLVLNKFVFIPQIKQSVEESLSFKPEKKEQAAEEEGDKVQNQKYKFENIITNVAGSLKNRYVKASFTLEGEGSDFAKLVESNHVKFVDATLSILSKLTMDDLASPGVKSIIKNELKLSFENILKNKSLKAIYFSQFVTN